jgi:hypothetical protein
VTSAGWLTVSGSLAMTRRLWWTDDVAVGLASYASLRGSSWTYAREEEGGERSGRRWRGKGKKIGDEGGSLWKKKCGRRRGVMDKRSRIEKLVWS